MQRRFVPLLLAAALLIVGCADGVLTPTAPASTASANHSLSRAASKDILYQLNDAVTGPQSRALTQVINRYGLTRGQSLVNGTVQRVSIGNANGHAEADIATELVATGAVAFAEVDELLKPAAIGVVPIVPNDSLYALQWHLPRINAPTAWAYATGSAAVIVAVCDGGVELTHPDLAANIHTPGYNVVDYTFDGSPVPSDGSANSGSTHGTKVAGMLGAVGNNISGVTGVNWTVEILSIRVTDDTSGNTTISKLVECVDYARSRGAKVVNVSYNGIASSASANTAGKALMAAGGLLVVAAGNDGANMNPTKNYPGIVVVGGTDENDAITSFSNYGNAIDLMAPALQITTTRPTWRGTYISNETGTSFASPIVAGVAALIWSYKPSLTPATVQSIVFTTAKSMGGMAKNGSTTYGYGRVDAGAALAKAATYP